MKFTDPKRYRQFARQVVKNTGHVLPIICVAVDTRGRLQITIRNHARGYAVGFVPMIPRDLIQYVAELNYKVVVTELNKDETLLRNAWPHIFKYYIDDAEFYRITGVPACTI